MFDLDLSDEKVRQYRENGFIVFDKFLEPHEVNLLRSRFEPLFRGEWETGIPPDEINWTEGRDSPDKDRVPARGVRALRSTRLPAGRAGTFRLPRWAA